MNQVEKENKIKKYLKEHGYKPRENANIDNYIKQLRDRLRKQNKDLYIEEINGDINIYIGKKKNIIKRNKALYIKINDEEEQRYKNLAIKKNTPISKIVRNLLDKECLK